MTQLFTNNAASRLAAPITSSDTVFDVAAGEGAFFPTITGSDYFIVTLVSSTTREIVKVTARSTDTFTVVRAQEGTSASAFAAVDVVELRLTAAALTAIEAVITDPELVALAGLTSAANKGIQFTGSGTAGTYDLTTAGKALLDDADASAQRTTLGLGTVATLASDTDTALTADSDSRVATQKAIKAYVDATVSAGGIPATIADAKGDLIAATADNTVARLAVGANNLVLVAASGETTGLKYQRGYANGVTTLTDGATVTWDFAGYFEMFAELTIAGARTLAFSNIVAGCRGVLHITESGASRSLALPGSSIVANTGAGVIALTGSSGGKQKWTFSYDGTNYWWEAGADYT